MSDPLEQVWQALAADLRRFLRRRIADPEVAEDLLQETFLKATQHLRGGADPATLPPWLFRVARNAVIDHHRRRRGDGPLPDEGLADPRDDALDQQDLLRLCGSFRNFVHALPPPYREALLLTAYDGLDQVEMAARLGIPVATAKSRVQRGRALLRQALLDCCRFEFDRRGRIVDWQRRDGGRCDPC
jgi:RNA polymerase sigma-70 factor (ECF subfamily)